MRGRVYDWTDAWGTPNTTNLRQLAHGLIADALDLPGGVTGRTARPAARDVAAHFVADVVYPLGDTAWRLTTAEIIAWLDTHAYLSINS